MNLSVHLSLESPPQVLLVKPNSFQVCALGHSTKMNPEMLPLFGSIALFVLNLLLSHFPLLPETFIQSCFLLPSGSISSLYNFVPLDSPHTNTNTTPTVSNTHIHTFSASLIPRDICSFPSSRLCLEIRICSY